MILIATFIPSTAAEVIPPAYPAPSPQGYIPSMLHSKSSLRSIVTGEDDLVSTPVRIASGLANPFIFLSNARIPSFRVLDTKVGSISFRLHSVYPGL